MGVLFRYYRGKGGLGKQYDWTENTHKRYEAWIRQFITEYIKGHWVAENLQAINTKSVEEDNLTKIDVLGEDKNDLNVLWLSLQLWQTLKEQQRLLACRCIGWYCDEVNWHGERKVSTRMWDWLKGKLQLLNMNQAINSIISTNIVC